MSLIRNGQTFTFHDPIDDVDWEHTFPDEMQFDNELLINWYENKQSRPIQLDFPFLSDEEAAYFTFELCPKNFKRYLLGIEENTEEAPLASCAT